MNNDKVTAHFFIWLHKALQGGNTLQASIRLKVLEVKGFSVVSGKWHSSLENIITIVLSFYRQSVQDQYTSVLI